MEDGRHADGQTFGMVGLFLFPLMRSSESCQGMKQQRKNIRDGSRSITVIGIPVISFSGMFTAGCSLLRPELPYGYGAASEGVSPCAIPGPLPLISSRYLFLPRIS